MGINSPLHGELIDPVMGVSYNKNVGLALDADLTLFVVDADVSLECGVARTHVRRKMRSCSDPRLKWNAKLLRPA